MNLMQSYYELLKNKSDDYYVELAEKEVLMIPLIIETAQNGNYSERKKSANILEKVSEKQPCLISVFVNYIVQAISTHNDFSSWCLWNSVKNVFNLIDGNIIEKEFFKALNSNVLGEFSIACECVEKYVLNFPESRDKIINILKNVRNRDFYIQNNLSEACGEIALEKALLLIDKLELSSAE